MDLLADMTLSTVLSALFTIILGGGGIFKYINWLQNSESLENRQQKLEKNLEGNTFTDNADTYKISQIDYIEEKSSWIYQLKKLIPLVRKLQGTTSITVRSVGANTREYVWETENGREDFSQYLCQVCDEDFPSVEYKKMESVSGDPPSAGLSKEIQLKISSLDSNKIAKTVERIPMFHTYYFDNYPGDARFNNKA